MVFFVGKAVCVSMSVYVCVCVCAWVREKEQEVKCEGLVFVALSNDFFKELLWEGALE